jgi:hypothetical protein
MEDKTIENTSNDNVEVVLEVVLEETQQTMFDDTDDFFQACQDADNVEIIEVMNINGGN